MLSDMGAEVVKLEPPEGDVTRGWGKMQAGLSGYYTQQNSGKRSISIDLDAPGSTKLVRRLAAKADIVIENFGTGVMERFGLGSDELRRENPGLVYISASGLGRTGPEAKAVAYGTLLQCYAGFAGLNRHADICLLYTSDAADE